MGGCRQRFAFCIGSLDRSDRAIGSSGAEVSAACEHLICTLHGLPLGWALVGAKADEREVTTTIIAHTPALTHRSFTLIGDKNYFGKTFETDLADGCIQLLRPARKGEKPLAGSRFFKPLRQIIESINQTLKGQLDLELPGGRTPGCRQSRVLGCQE